LTRLTIPNAYKLIVTIKNWPDVVLREFGLKKDILLGFRNGLIMKGPEWWYGVDVFHNQPYGEVNVKDRVVVDVGGFVGDTGLYFARKGARKVYVFEPIHAYCEMARENMQRNGVGNVEILERAVTGKKGTTTVLYKTESATVPCVSLEDIIADYGITGNAVLKLDCEGCEYDILFSSDAALDPFKELIMEYHDLHLAEYHDHPTRSLKRLEERLREAGFETRVTKRYGENEGILYARRA
jgi:FkbM family methyltransferase